MCKVKRSSHVLLIKQGASIRRTWAWCSWEEEEDEEEEAMGGIWNVSLAELICFDKHCADLSSHQNPERISVFEHDLKPITEAEPLSMFWMGESDGGQHCSPPPPNSTSLTACPCSLPQNKYKSVSTASQSFTPSLSVSRQNQQFEQNNQKILKIQQNNGSLWSFCQRVHVKKERTSWQERLKKC